MIVNEQSQLREGVQAQKYREPCLCTKESRVPDFEKKGLSLFNCAHGVRTGIWADSRKERLNEESRWATERTYIHFLAYLSFCVQLSWKGCWVSLPAVDPPSSPSS